MDPWGDMFGSTSVTEQISSPGPPSSSAASAASIRAQLIVFITWLMYATASMRFIVGKIHYAEELNFSRKCRAWDGSEDPPV
ncbi:hypothetical protein PF008_g27566 [Phytophthora fragariae]|uniref:Uncharacterized protein n=1 Tax=Phytophthora fragariae TaxID=53985 RepID=A0A6G0QDZ5_9STRA|nr:hypothetical protein PF008_g27566 [Phytophthora fragariae]